MLVTRPHLSPLDVLLLSPCGGLAGGLLEVGMKVLCRSIDSTYRLYMMSRHFVWLAPLANLLLFSSLGLLLALATKFWPRCEDGSACESSASGPYYRCS